MAFLHGSGAIVHMDGWFDIHRFPGRDRDMIPLITRVQAKNYRSIAEIDVHLGMATVLVGRNGSGKSTFVDILRFVSHALNFGLRGALIERGEVESLRRWVAGDPLCDIEITVTVEGDNDWCEYGFVIASRDRNDYIVRREFCLYGTTPDDAKLYFDAREGNFTTLLAPDGIIVTNPQSFDSHNLVLPLLGFSGNRDLAELHAFLSNLKYYSIIPELLKETQYLANEHVLLENGENSASVLNRLIEDSNPNFSELLLALEKVVGDISDIRVARVGRYLVTQFKHDFPDGSTAWFDAAQESYGTLRLLGILLACYQPSPTFFIALEEPELAIHPGAMRLLCEILQSLSGRTQMLITTQSPDLISRFGADQLRVVEKVGGITKIGPLRDDQRAVIEQDLFSGGDLLRIEGLFREGSVTA